MRVVVGPDIRSRSRGRAVLVAFKKCLLGPSVDPEQSHDDTCEVGMLARTQLEDGMSHEGVDLINKTD